MFFRKKSPTVSAKKCKTKLDLSLKLDSANFESCNNVQTTANGLNSVGVLADLDISSAKKILACKDGYFYVLLEDGVYVCKNGKSKALAKCKVTAGACVEYNRNLYFSADGVGTFQLNPTNATLMYCNGFNSMTHCGDRLVAVNSQGVVICPAGEMDGWYDSQTIYTHNPCCAVVSIGTKLYVLGNTCYVLEPSAEDIDVKIHPFAHQMGEVASDSVVRMGKRAVYATRDGLRLLSSDKITPIFDHLNQIVNFENCVACEHQGKYYVACKQTGAIGNNVLLILDVDKLDVMGKMQFSSSIDSLYSDGLDLYTVLGANVYRLVPKYGPSSFSQCFIDMGCSDTKYLDYMVIKTNNTVNVWIETDREKRRYTVAGNPHLQKIPIRGMGRDFSVQIQASAEGMSLERVELIAHTYEV